MSEWLVWGWALFGFELSSELLTPTSLPAESVSPRLHSKASLLLPLFPSFVNANKQKPNPATFCAVLIISLPPCAPKSFLQTSNNKGHQT